MMMAAEMIARCRRTVWRSAAAEARGIGWLQNANDLARRRRSAASAGWVRRLVADQ
jgi:hypothetical protein